MLGLIVNPIAGMGGKVGLKGTDGAETLAAARALGAQPIAPARAARALAKLTGKPGIALLAAPGAMGAAAARAAGLSPCIIGAVRAGETTAQDTRAAARAMAEAGAALLLFAGGDGTARDLYDAVSGRVPILGIPTGVKMHSAVFATSPEGAGQLAALTLSAAGAGGVELRDGEVMDIDEVAVRAGRLSARLYGYARVPYRRALVQGAKAASALGSAGAVAAVGREIAAGMEPGRLYIIGPGTTTAPIIAALGIEGTLLGVDAVRDRALVGADLNEALLLALTKGARATIIVTVIGGQGYVFGRGNQQSSAAVIRRVGRENIVVVAGIEKLVSLGGGPLRVDTGDLEVDRILAGFIRVRVAPNQSTVARIEP